MRNIIILLAAVCLVTSVSVLSCNESQNTETVQNNNSDSTDITDSTNTAYMKDMESYRKQIGDTIDANIKSIADFKMKIKNDTKHAKAFYDDKIEALEKSNIEMKKKITAYKAEGKDKWEVFKKEFSQGMDTLGKAFKDLTTKA
ncbi:MAG TPA: hypothetical protein VK808_05560 [Bacteroidia bacterium]|jgi:LEA14-like dessication related protein|nr:hypothetical protein [Bacteroidia bacterium]